MARTGLSRQSHVAGSPTTEVKDEGRETGSAYVSYAESDEKTEGLITHAQ